MAANDEFAARIARIEARMASGQKAEYAPLPDEIGEIRKAPRRGLFSGIFGKVMLPLAGLAFLGGAFATELVALLPADVITASNPVSAAIRSQMTPEQIDSMTSGSDLETPGDQGHTDPGLARLLMRN